MPEHVGQWLAPSAAGVGVGECPFFSAASFFALGRTVLRFGAAASATMLVDAGLLGKIKDEGWIRSMDGTGDEKRTVQVPVVLHQTHRARST